MWEWKMIEALSQHVWYQACCAVQRLTAASLKREGKRSLDSLLQITDAPPHTNPSTSLVTLGSRAHL